MIFKTFDSDIDKISSKWGVFGKSFYDFVDIANKRKIEINDLITYKGMSLSEAKNEVGSIWKNWFPSKKDLTIDVDPELTDDIANKMLQQIKTIDQAKDSWNSYFSELKEQGHDAIVDLIKNTDDLSKLTGKDLVKANQEARASALAHNEAIKNMTFSAKAGTVVMKALSVAGNMIVMWGITKVIELVAKGIDNLAHSAEYCQERVDELMSSYQSALDEANSNAKTIEGLAARYEELSDGVNNLGRNVSLTTDEYEEYNDICNQIADMFPNLIQGYTDEGTQIIMACVV